MNRVVRCGDWVLRPAGAHTLLVQDLLAVLARAGCGWAPRPGGLSDDGRERLSFVPGLASWELLAAGGDPYTPDGAEGAGPAGRTGVGSRSGCWTPTAGKRSTSRPSWPRSLPPSRTTSRSASARPARVTRSTSSGRVPASR